MVNVKINSKELISKVSTLIAMATTEKDEISQESQVNVFNASSKSWY